MKDVASWSPQEVSDWLKEKGFHDYLEFLHHLNGQALLNLTKEDLQKVHQSLIVTDDGRHLLEKIETLKFKYLMAVHKNGLSNGHVTEAGDLSANGKAKDSCVLNSSHDTVLQIPVHMSENSFPPEWKKTAAAFLYALCCFTLTSVTISVVNERVPPKEVDPPLPDKFFDFFDRVEGAFSVCEITGMILVLLWLVQWLLLKYKSIVGRRFFCIVGTLYLYRCLTMYVTTLPVPGKHFQCAPKVSGDLESMMYRVLKVIGGAGLSITGSHNMCGDFLYSGHTVILTLSYLFIKEYSPKRYTWYPRFCLMLSALGVFCILLAHDHYTVDVAVAYYVTTRLFWWYHTMANEEVLKEASPNNLMSRVWWFRFFLYFEANIHGAVPRRYELPFPWSKVPWTRRKYSRIDI
ncbi:phosphatidylcholine:ceramide cholinephosphotransferase 1-like [Scleropages formosus]|uniref:Phosphatidylcholine:ceramide cholinephosphotransferase 1 n=1 Tax=Scleropages formosus TaxID=113540 RepID=A0A0N8JW82_SCLFO|nr:phosphatidylcholine:ceramide cholinephosphotransferase 1-like [Scleropages formosus]KPP60209.1 phosphatidylcholine:ceramide cholinephosphotransferase 1-like [Scleropages formosus]